jgi:hypothetical protein
MKDARPNARECLSNSIENFMSQAYGSGREQLCYFWLDSKRKPCMGERYTIERKFYTNVGARQRFVDLVLFWFLNML